MNLFFQRSLERPTFNAQPQKADVVPRRRSELNVESSMVAALRFTHRAPRRASAFTLLELMLAIAIFSVVVLAI